MSLKDLSGEDQMVAVNKFMKYKELVYEIVQEHERKGQEIEFDQTLELLDKKLYFLGCILLNGVIRITAPLVDIIPFIASLNNEIPPFKNRPIISLGDDRNSEASFIN